MDGLFYKRQRTRTNYRKWIKEKGLNTIEIHPYDECRRPMRGFENRRNWWIKEPVR